MSCLPGASCGASDYQARSVEMIHAIGPISVRYWWACRPAAWSSVAKGSSRPDTCCQPERSRTHRNARSPTGLGLTPRLVVPNHALSEARRFRGTRGGGRFGRGRRAGHRGVGRSHRVGARLHWGEGRRSGAPAGQPIEDPRSTRSAWCEGCTTRDKSQAVGLDAMASPASRAQRRLYAPRPVMSRGAFRGRVLPAQRVLGWWAAAHNQRSSRNARSVSDGRYRPGLVPSGAIRAIAFSLSAGSACW